MTRRAGYAVVLGLCAIAAACSSDDASAPPPGGGGSGAEGGSGAGMPGETPTWWEDVAPIVYEHCNGCHVEGGIAPFALLTYEEVSPVAALMKAQTADRSMPPWHADNSGECQTYADARWLTEEQIATIGAWVDGGSPEGDPANAPAMPAPANLDVVSATLDIGVDYTPDGSITDDYRCFVVDPGNASDMYLTAYEVKPGNPAVVHHVILYSLADAAAQAEAEALDAESAEPGYTCFGGSGVGDSTFIAGWAPGTPVTRYPEGTGVELAANRKAVLQIHYNTLNGVEPDHTTIDITLAPSVDRPAQIIPIVNGSLALPPGQEYVTSETSMANPAPIPVTLWGSYPHMHQLGVDLEVTVGDECVMSVPRWDFHWQQFYFYETPLTVMPGEELHLTCGYDTRGREMVTTWGEGTQDEMCLNFFYVTVP
jgi:hypothetical protein